MLIPKYLGRFVVPVFCFAAVAVLASGCSPKQQKTANQPGAANPQPQTKETASSDADWQPTDASNALDGQAFKASKTFLLPEHNSRFDVEVICAVKSDNLQIQISSYEDTKNTAGGYDGAPFALLNLEDPAGRIKVNNREPAGLGDYFKIADYRNVIVFRAISADGRIFDPTLTQFATLADYFKALLPVELELETDGGTSRIEIPANSDVLNFVIEKCAKPAEPLANRSSTDSPSPPTSESTQQQSPSDSSAEPSQNADANK